MAITLNNELIDGKLYSEQDDGSGRMKIIIVCAGILLFAGGVGAGFLYHANSVAGGAPQPQHPTVRPSPVLLAEAKNDKIVIREKGADGTSKTEGVVISSQAKFAAKTPSTLDVNTATIEQLQTLKGVGPVMAKKIIANRPYANVDDLIKVKGIGNKKLAKLKPFLKVEKAAGKGEGETAK